MIENLRMYYQTHGVETCVATLIAEIDGREVVRTLDFSGNNISGGLWGSCFRRQHITGTSRRGTARLC